MCGFGYVWANQGVVENRAFLSAFGQRMRDMYVQDWSASVALTSENRLFMSIKNVFKLKDYLNICDRNLRVALTRIRLSSHVFMIERGRWGKNRLHVSERKCSLCGVLEDEFHCLFKCPRFNNERKCISALNVKNYRDFIKIFKINNRKIQLKLSVLCQKILVEYRNFI